MIFKFSEKVETRLLDALERIAKALEEMNERRRKEILQKPPVQRGHDDLVG